MTLRPEIPSEALQKLGGAQVILATAPDSKSISAVIDGLRADGKLLVVGAGPESITVTPIQLIRGKHSPGMGFRNRH